MEEIKKIDLDTLDSSSGNSPSEHIKSSSDKKGLKLPRILLVVFLLIIILFVSSFFAVVLPAQKVYTSAQKTQSQAKLAWGALKKQNVEVASVEMVKTKQELVNTQKDFYALSFLQYVPIAGGYYNDADHLIKAGFHGIDAAITLVDSIKPYADVLGLKGKGSFVMGSAEQRVQTAIMTMGKITPNIDKISQSASLAKKEIDAVDPNHYPSFFGGEKIKNQLAMVRSVTDEGVSFVEQARPLIKVLPGLLGETKEKKYLVLFQNDKELRATGGFITAYAVFRIDKGIIHVDGSDDIYALDNNLTKRGKVPEPILKYLPKVTTFNLRDSNLSPDYIESMKVFEALYKNGGGKLNVDGIIALDTSVLVSTIKILDDEVIAGGIKFTSKIDKRCDCPQVIYVLEDNISRPVNYVKTGRKDLLGTLMYSIMEKALKSSPKLYWGPLLQEMLAQADQKHILFYLYNQDAQSGVEALNLAGKIKSFEGDYLHINDVNFGGQKANLYTKENVEQNYEVKNGEIVKTITIRYKNSYPPSDCNLERGNLCLNATLRNWVRVYAPKGSQLINSQGSEVKVTSYDELGKTVFDGFLTVRPLGTATYTLSYKLPFKLAGGSPLPLIMQKQPGTYGNEYVIKVGGREVEKFPLLTDKEIKLKL